MLRLTNIRSDDDGLAARTQSYLAEFADPGVRARPAEQLRRAMTTGLGLVVEDGWAVRACSLIYKYDPPTSDAVFAELGSMRVTQNGRGLQELLAKVSVLQIYLEEAELDHNVIFAVVTPGSASEHILVQKCHFEDWTPPETLMLMRAEAGTPFLAEKRVLKAPIEAIWAALGDLRRWHRGKRDFAAPKGEEMVRLDLGWFTPQLLDVANNIEGRK